MEKAIFPSRPRNQLHAYPGQILQNSSKRAQTPEAPLLQYPPIEAETHPGRHHHHLFRKHLGDWKHTEVEASFTDVLLPVEWAFDKREAQE